MTTETRKALHEIHNRISFMFMESCEEFEDMEKGTSESYANIKYREALLDVQDMITTYLLNEE